MAITLKDVASVAGVSTATVSRALAGSERVAPQTANHVRTIADELGYRFDNVARALRKKRSNLVGMVAPDYNFPYAQDLLFALNQELFHDELVLASVASFGSVDHELAQVERLLGQRIDALVFIPAHPVESTPRQSTSRAKKTSRLFNSSDACSTRRRLTSLLDYVFGVDFALRSIRPGAVRSITYIDDDLANSDQGKRAAWQHLTKNFPQDKFSTVTVFRSGPTQRASFEIALSKLNCAPLPDLIIVSSNEALPFVVDQIEQVPPAEMRPLVLCLDSARSDVESERVSVASLEFPMSATARAVMERVYSALNNEDIRRETVRIPPFLNLSQL